MIILKNPIFRTLENYEQNLNFIPISIFFNFSAFSEECPIMLGDEVDPEEFSESTGKKFFLLRFMR